MPGAETALNIMHVCYPMTLLVLLGGAAVLFMRSGGRRSRIYLGIAMLLWTLPFLAFTINGCHYYVPGGENIENEIMSPFLVMSAVFYGLILLPYPLELTRRHWLTPWRLIIWMLPVLVLLAIYLVGTIVTGGDFIEIYSRRRFFEEIHHFNVWFRLVLLITPFVYAIITLIDVFRVERRWQRWRLEHSESSINMSRSWLYFYFSGLLTIGAMYIWMCFSVSPWARLGVAGSVLIFFCYVIYKALFSDGIYPRVFYMDILDGGFQAEPADNSAFERRIPQYVQQIEKWFTADKPYLRHNFKMGEVNDILPLNRSYLSRVFNEGFGMSFVELVRRRRMQEAERLLVADPAMSITEIADRCGFAGNTTFHRSFVSTHDGTPPGEWRSKMLRNKGNINKNQA